MGMRALLAMLAVAAFGAGCSSDHKVTPPPPTTTTVTTPATDVPPPRNPHEKAVQACAAAVPDPAKLAVSSPTTVGDMRNITLGSVPTPRSAVFPTRDRQAFAAWCWTRQTGNNFDVYKVTPGLEAVLAVHLRNFNPRDAHGAPSIP
jgi:hypothetical protein